MLMFLRIFNVSMYRVDLSHINHRINITVQAHSRQQAKAIAVDVYRERTNNICKGIRLCIEINECSQPFDLIKNIAGKETTIAIPGLIAIMNDGKKYYHTYR